MWRMRYARRVDRSARVEMVPLIDVIFLLLTFFIYSLVVMVRAQVLPVELVRVEAGEAAPGDSAEIAAITIDAAGAIFFNREPIEPEALDARLAELASQDPPPLLFLAMEQASAGGTVAVDRGPVLIGLIERVRQAGVTNFSIVGQP